MFNKTFVSNLTSFKNPILNFIKENHKYDDMFLYFLSGKSPASSAFINPTREGHLGAHCFVSSKSLKENIYFTFNCWSNNEFFNGASFTLREDYVNYVKETIDENANKTRADKTYDDKYETSIYAIDIFDQMIYKIRMCDIFRHLGDTENIILNKKCKYNCYVISTKLACQASKFDYSEYEPTSVKSFRPQYWKPETISNFVYSKFRKSDRIVKYAIYNAIGRKMREGLYKSLSECYESLNKDLLQSLPSKGAFTKALARKGFMAVDNSYLSKSGTAMKVFLQLSLDENMVFEDRVDQFFSFTETTDGDVVFEKEEDDEICREEELSPEEEDAIINECFEHFNFDICEIIDWNQIVEEYSLIDEGDIVIDAEGFNHMTDVKREAERLHKPAIDVSWFAWAREERKAGRTPYYEDWLCNAIA